MNQNIQIGQPVMASPQQVTPQQQQYQQQIVYGQQSVGTINYQKQELYRQPTSRLTEKLLCDSCQEINWSTTDYKIGKTTWLVGGGICALGCLTSGIGLVFGFIPCCLSECKDVEHKCQRCNKVLGLKTFEIGNNK